MGVQSGVSPPPLGVVVMIIRAITIDMIGVCPLTPRNPYISLSPVCPRLSRLYLFPVLVVVLLKSLIFCSPTDIITMLASSEFDPLDTLQLSTGHPSAESKDLPCRI